MCFLFILFSWQPIKGAPDKSIANGGHALSKIHVVGDVSSTNVISNAVFNVEGAATPTYPIVTDPPFAVTGSATSAKCPAKVAPAPPSGGKSFASPDGRWKAEISGLTAGIDEITFKVTFNSLSGWFGLGVSSDGTMISGGAGSDIVTCESNAPKTDMPHACRWWVTEKAMPTLSNNEMVKDMTCEFSNNVRSKLKKMRSQCFDTTFTIIVVIIVVVIFFS